eukprot:g3205.t1
MAPPRQTSKKAKGDGAAEVGNNPSTPATVGPDTAQSPVACDGKQTASCRSWYRYAFCAAAASVLLGAASIFFADQPLQRTAITSSLQQARLDTPFPQTGPKPVQHLQHPTELDFSQFEGGWRNDTILHVLRRHVVTRVPLVLRNVGVPDGVLSSNVIADSVEEIVREDRADGFDATPYGGPENGEQDLVPGEDEQEPSAGNLLTLRSRSVLAPESKADLKPDPKSPRKLKKKGGAFIAVLANLSRVCCIGTGLWLFRNPGLPYGKLEAPIEGPIVWDALKGEVGLVAASEDDDGSGTAKSGRGSTGSGWAGHVHREMCESLHIQDEQGFLDRGNNFRCTEKQLKKALLGPGSYQLYLREDLLDDPEEYSGWNRPVLPYLHEAILESPATPPMEIVLDDEEDGPGKMKRLIADSRVLRGGSPGSHAFAHVDCYSNILLSYWGRKDMYLFDAIPVFSTVEKIPRKRRDDQPYASSFESLWRLLRIGEDLSLEPNKGNSGVETEGETRSKRKPTGHHKAVEALKDRLNETNVPVFKVRLGEGDAMFIPELFFHDAAMLDPVLGMNIFYTSPHNGGEALCKLLKGFGSKGCGGKIGAREAAEGARIAMAEGNNWAEEESVGYEELLRRVLHAMAFWFFMCLSNEGHIRVATLRNHMWQNNAILKAYYPETQLPEWQALERGNRLLRLLSYFLMLLVCSAFAAMWGMGDVEQLTLRRDLCHQNCLLATFPDTQACQVRDDLAVIQYEGNTYSRFFNYTLPDPAIVVDSQTRVRVNSTAHNENSGLTPAIAASASTSLSRRFAIEAEDFARCLGYVEKEPLAYGACSRGRRLVDGRCEKLVVCFSGCKVSEQLWTDYLSGLEATSRAAAANTTSTAAGGTFKCKDGRRFQRGSDGVAVQISDGRRLETDGDHDVDHSVLVPTRPAREILSPTARKSFARRAVLDAQKSLLCLPYTPGQYENSYQLVGTFCFGDAAAGNGWCISVGGILLAICIANILQFLFENVYLYLSVLDESYDFQEAYRKCFGQFGVIFVHAVLLVCTVGPFHQASRMDKIEQVVVTFLLVFALDQAKNLLVQPVIWWLVIRRCGRVQPGIQEYNEEYLLQWELQESLLDEMQRRTREFLEKRAVLVFIIGLVGFYAVFLMLSIVISDCWKISDEPSECTTSLCPGLSEQGRLSLYYSFTYLDFCIMVIFVAEILLKLFGYGTSFILDPWNFFDSLIVLVSFICWFLFLGSTVGTTGLGLLRLLRLVRVMVI